MAESLVLYDRTKDAGAVAAQLETTGLPFEVSLGYQVRSTHRLLQRYLQSLIEPHGVTLGMWYYLRVLWREDGLTQRELARRVGTMEPTTLTAIAGMERHGFVRRARSTVDRRRIHVRLTPKGRALQDELEPLAISVVRQASNGLSLPDIARLLATLKTMQANLSEVLGETALADTEV